MRSFHTFRWLFFSSLFFLCVLWVQSAAAADDVVWSALVYASEEKEPAPAPVELAAYQQKLQHVFGYNQFQILSQHREIMDSRFEHWLLPGNGFCLLVDTKKFRGNHQLNLQLYQEKRLVVQTIALLARKSPIFLRGPLYGDGQLIIVLGVE